LLFYVQHLLGIGHQRRGATLSRALQAAGMAVTYVSGGHQIPNLDLGGAALAQLPPVRAVDLYFKELVDEHGEPIDDDWRAARAAALLQIYTAADPHVVILELYPFGRRQMRFELLPLLDAAKGSANPPVIVSSVRDILVASPKPERLVEMLERVERYFDHVLVHGDPKLIPFDETFPHAAEIAGKISYTGYVVDDRGLAGGPGSDGYGEVIVSAGGGAVGEALLRTAMAARARSVMSDRTWRVMAGVTASGEEIAALRRDAPPGVIVEAARGDFPSLLMNCALSISQGGYNTIMECLRARCRTLVVPYAGGLETEQTLRASLLEKRGALTVLSEADMNPETMAAALGRAVRPGPGIALDTGGAARSAELVQQWAQSRDWD
jgi:predicted glycosyltransferase